MKRILTILILLGITPIIIFAIQSYNRNIVFQSQDESTFSGKFKGNQLFNLVENKNGELNLVSFRIKVDSIKNSSSFRKNKAVNYNISKNILNNIWKKNKIKQINKEF